MNTMRIDAPPGTKVKFTLDMNGHPHEGPEAKKHLKLGETYTVKSTIIHNWSTDVYLEEVPNRAFNSVLFEEA